jgi:hypothetical protein
MGDRSNNTKPTNVNKLYSSALKPTSSQRKSGRTPTLHKLHTKTVQGSSVASPLDLLLENISQDEETTKKAIEVILGKPSSKNFITEHISAEIIKLQTEVKSMNSRIDEMEQYSRGNCLKLSGICEEGSTENTDEMVLKIVNRLVHSDHEQIIGLQSIDRTHRVGRQKKDGKLRDIMVKFCSYRIRTLVYANKRNLKSHNKNPSIKSRIFINEALTRQCIEIYNEARKLVREDLINSVWTYDGKIILKLRSDRKITITSDEEFKQLLLQLGPETVSTVTVISTPVSQA